MTLSHDTSYDPPCTLGTAATDAILNIYFQPRIDTNIHVQHHVQARVFFHVMSHIHVYGHNVDNYADSHRISRKLSTRALQVLPGSLKGGVGG